MGHRGRKLDLTGQRFGKLTVLRPAENIGSRTAWVCRCDCGAETVAKTVHLRGGHVTSCGGACKAGIESRLHYVDGTCVEMLRSKTVRRNNHSGVPGVDWLAGVRRWRATIGFQGRRIYLGKFDRFEDAVEARKAAEIRLHDAFVARFFQKPDTDRPVHRSTGPCAHQERR